MKKILFIITILVGSILDIAAQTVYFSQDFNSSSDIDAYVGSGANKFNAIATVGNNTVAIVNNKFQLNKQEGTGNNRGGYTRTSAFPAGTPQFLKYSMEVTISNNSTNINNGFQFTVGQITSTAPAAPGGGQIHSLLLVNPTENPGEFTLVSGDLSSSSNFSGTQTLVWYINNSGAPVGYTAPDGSISSLQDDAFDVWVVNGNTKILALDEVPAVSPLLELKSFKLANNPSFNATIDIDDIVLSEEPVVVIPKIVAISSAPAVTVPLKTNFDLIPFASQTEVTYDDNTKELVDISYAPATAYNQYITGTYEIIGTPIPRNGTVNPDGISFTTSVTVKDQINLTNTFSPNNDGKNDTWIIPELMHYREISVEVFDRDGNLLFKTLDPSVGWDGRNQQGRIIPGSYFYIIKVPALLLVKKGVLTVIK